MTWWHPLWIHVDRTFYSLSWCLRHQGHLRDCLKCVLIGKQLSNNSTFSITSQRKRKHRRWPACCTNGRCVVEPRCLNIHNDKGLVQTRVPQEIFMKYSNTSLGCKPGSRETPRNIRDFSQFFLATWEGVGLPHPDFPNNRRENIPGIQNLKSHFQDLSTKRAWRANVNIIIYTVIYNI